MNSQITLVCADTGPNMHNSYAALKLCVQKFPVKEALFFTDVPNQLQFNDPQITNIRIQNLNQKYAYDFFILSQLPNYIRTSHYLIIQNDGFILNPLAWQDTWMQYDYIGAPWGLHPLHHWPPHQDVTPNNNVGNGGFSLRSTRLGNLVKDLYCSFSRSKNFLPEHWYPEDCFICRDLRPTLESKYQIKFAPASVATLFSCENKPYTNQFGFHGKETMKINGIKYCE